MPWWSVSLDMTDQLRPSSLSCAKRTPVGEYFDDIVQCAATMIGVDFGTASDMSHADNALLWHATLLWRAITAFMRPTKKWLSKNKACAYWMSGSVVGGITLALMASTCVSQWMIPLYMARDRPRQVQWLSDLTWKCIWCWCVCWILIMRKPQAYANCVERG